MSFSHHNIRDLVGNLIGAHDVFRRHDIDFYRIGGLALWEAAARQNISLDNLIEVLSELRPNPSPPPTSTMGLITYIDARYHSVHRKQLLSAIGLAKAINAKTANKPECPTSLANLLTLLFDTLEDHQSNEEDNLYPAIINSPQHTLRYPVSRAIMEHDEISDQLDTLARLTENYTAQKGARQSIRVLYKLCSVLDGDLRLHMHLENNLLYPPFVEESAKAS
jgi:regulator of cell morphogenesis and NO signaling